MVRDLWWKGFIQKVSFEFRMKKVEEKDGLKEAWRGETGS